MGYLEVAHLRCVLPDSRVLFDDVSFRVGMGSKSALIGANGTGKTTIMRLIAGDLEPDGGTVTSAGGVGVMPQFIGSVRDRSTVRDLLLSVAPGAVRGAGHTLAAAEAALEGDPDDGDAATVYAQAVADWSELGGYDLETLWSIATTTALGQPFGVAGPRPVVELSGGEQKRLCLEALLRGREEVLLLDEPDNYLDVPAKRWLERQLRETVKTVLFVTHDRELLARSAERCITIEGRGAWVHGGGFATYSAARRARIERLDELHRRWEEEHQHLITLVRTLQQQAARSPAMASRYAAAQTRLRKYEEAGPPAERPEEQEIRVRLRGGRTGVKVVICEGLELTGLTKPFDLDVAFGERLGVLGANGSGKSHFLRLLAGESVAHSGKWRLGARVVPGFFAQKHERADLAGRTPLEALWDYRLDRGRAIGALRRYELDRQADQPFETLSGGQQARLQILLLELGGATLLVLDEPTDNLDIESAEALEAYTGTVMAVTHDRWFARSFDRFVVFTGGGDVREHSAPVWEERVATTARRTGPTG